MLADRLNLNFHTDKVWDDKGKKMTWDVDYLRDNRDENMGFLSKTLLPDGTEIPGTNFDYNYLQHRKVDVVSSALDFILPFEKYKITAGAKVSFTNTRNGINYDTSDPTLVQDDYFRYKEQIYALTITGRSPSSMRRKAANSPPGPAPTTITCGLPSTLLYIAGYSGRRD